MITTCPYCKNPTSQQEYEAEYSSSYCFFHKDTKVRFRESIPENNLQIQMYSLTEEGNYIIIRDNKIMVFKKYYTYILTLPLDPNLTPDNFKNKIKTYINFS